MMKTKQLLMALILGLALTVPAAPAGWAMPEQPPAEPAPLALEAPVWPLVAEPAMQTATPTPTPVAPPLPPEPGGKDTGVPGEISSVPGVTEDWWAAVQEQIRRDMYGLSPDEAPRQGQPTGPSCCAAGEKRRPNRAASRPGAFAWWNRATGKPNAVLPAWRRCWPTCGTSLRAAEPRPAWGLPTVFIKGQSLVVIIE